MCRGVLPTFSMSPVRMHFWQVVARLKLGIAQAHELAFELVHPGRREQHRRVVRHEHVARLADAALGGEEVEVGFAKFVGLHGKIIGNGGQGFAGFFFKNVPAGRTARSTNRAETIHCAGRAGRRQLEKRRPQSLPAPQHVGKSRNAPNPLALATPPGQFIPL